MASPPRRPPAGACAPCRPRPAHVDDRLIAEALEALAWWASQAPLRPTSSIIGGGAIDFVEQALAGQLGGRQVLALPSATFAIFVALRSAGVDAGDDVLVSALDWPAARAVASVLGARVVPVPVGLNDLVMDPGGASDLVTPATKAVVVTHLHGVVADVAGLREVLPGHVSIIEDCAQALGAGRCGQPAGTAGDFAAFSLGPGKAASAGELGLLAAASPRLYRRAVAVSQHPARQLLAGIETPSEAVFIARPSPLAAVLGAHKLSRWPVVSQQLRNAERPFRDAILKSPTQHLAQVEQQTQPGTVPVLLPPDYPPEVLDELARRCSHGPTSVRVGPSGACVDPRLGAADRQLLCSLLDRVRIARVEIRDDHDPDTPDRPGTLEPAGQNSPGPDGAEATSNRE